MQQSGPGEIKSDLDAQRAAVGLGPAVVEVPSKPVGPSADQSRQMASLKNLDALPISDWMKDNARQATERAIQNGMASKIEEMAADHKTAKEIAKALGIDVEDVTAVRLGLGIPSMSAPTHMGGGSQPISPEFVAWRDQYLAGKSAKPAEAARPEVKPEPPITEMAPQGPTPGFEPPPPRRGRPGGQPNEPVETRPAEQMRKEADKAFQRLRRNGINAEAAEAWVRQRDRVPQDWVPPLTPEEIMAQSAQQDAGKVIPDTVPEPVNPLADFPADRPATPARKPEWKQADDAYQNWRSFGTSPEFAAAKVREWGGAPKDWEPPEAPKASPPAPAAPEPTTPAQPAKIGLKQTDPVARIAELQAKVDARTERMRSAVIESGPRKGRKAFDDDSIRAGNEKDLAEIARLKEEHGITDPEPAKPGESASVKRITEKVKIGEPLTPAEEYVLAKRDEGGKDNSFRKLMKDPKLIELYGGELSYTTVQNLEISGRAKQGKKSIAVEQEESADSSHLSQRIVYELDENGERVLDDYGQPIPVETYVAQVKELRHADKVVSHVQKAHDALGRETDRLDKISKSILAEVESGEYTPERQQYWAGEIARIHQEAAEQRGREEGQGGSVLGGVQESSGEAQGQGGVDLPPSEVHPGERPPNDPSFELFSGLPLHAMFPRQVQHASAAADALGRATVDALGRVSGKMSPTTTRLSREAGEKLTRFVVANTYAETSGKIYGDRVLGPRQTMMGKLVDKITGRKRRTSTEEIEVLAGAVFEELKSREAEANFLRLSQEGSAKAAKGREDANKARLALSNGIADPALRAQTMKALRDAQKAMVDGADQATKYMKLRREVTHMIDKDWSPLKTEQDFQDALTNPDVQIALKAYETEFAPVAEDQMRRYQGEEAEPPESPTQIPGMPLTSLAIRDTSQFRGSGSGNLTNLKVRKPNFIREAGRGAEQYELNLRKLIEYRMGMEADVAKVEMLRTYIKEGIGRVEEPGQRVDGWKEVTFMDVPKSLQPEGGGKRFYVKEEAYPEFRKALNVDLSNDAAKVIAPIMQPLMQASLASTVEAATHGMNLAGSVLAPGVRAGDIYENSLGYIRGSKEAQEKILALAQMGALKAKGQETGTLVGAINDLSGPTIGEKLPEGASKLDPTMWAGKALDGWSTVMRMTLGDAFDRLASKNLVENTETNKRDFINQWTGQYEGKSQNALIRFLRESKMGFAVAGSTMTIRAARILAGGPTPTATSAKASLMMRAETIGKVAAIFASAAAYNLIKWGRADGDDQTPLGAIKIGNTTDGKTKTFDLGAITGVRRGLRSVGMLASIEGARRDQSDAQVESNAFENVAHALMHPGFGPGPSFIHTAMTGKNSLGMKVAKAPGPDSSEPRENLKAAFANANPIYQALTGSDRPGQDVPTGEKAAKLLGPFGFKYHSQMPDSARNLKFELHKMSELYQEQVKEQRMKGLKAKMPKELHELQQVVGRINEYERKSHREGASEEYRKSMREAQERLASAALKKLRRQNNLAKQAMGR